MMHSVDDYGDVSVSIFNSPDADVSIFNSPDAEGDSTHQPGSSVPADFLRDA